MKKRRQHYVWKHYLSSWAVNNQIFCKMENEIFKTNLNNVANERDFYRVPSLTKKDSNFIKKLLINNLPNPLKILNENWLSMQEFVSNYRNKIDLSKYNEKFKTYYENIMSNFEEELQSRIETDSVKYLTKIKNGDIEFYKNDHDNIFFNFYIAHQYLRTRQTKNRIYKVFDKKFSSRFYKIWNVVLHILATNLSYELYADIDEFHIVLLVNYSDIQLITGDQPIINIFVENNNQFLQEKKKFYYPICPKLGILITKESELSNIDLILLDSKQVKYYNKLIFNNSEKQIYADNEKVLSEL